jgi:signal peptidase II
MRSGTSRALAAACVALVTVDWLTKFWILNRVALGETLAVVEGWFYLTHRQNTGVAFGLLADIPSAWAPLLLGALSLLVVGAFAWMLAGTPDRLTRLAIVLVIAGAVGNAGDRLATGSVTDFILISFFPYVFNVADAAITVGAVLFALRLFRREGDAAPAPATS